MEDAIALMIAPLAACVILTGMHAYLGLHVLRRGVIFVDLALAQLAAFGATIGFLAGLELHSWRGYFCSLGFTLVGAAIFAATRHRKPMVPHEAVIGIVYVVAAAAAVMVLSRAPGDGEELKALMVGHLLFVGWGEIFKILVLYSVIGAVHFAARRKFLLVSEDPEQAYERGLNVRGWDFLFYGTFGVVVTSSTEVAGVLLVFSFLIVPAVCALLLATRFSSQLFIAWACGFVTSVAGLILSYWGDFPTGASVVCSFGVCALLCAGLRVIRE